MRRPPSYSDSFLVLSSNERLEPLFPRETVVPDDDGPPPVTQRIAIFIFKGSLHILFISAFETTFYFLYVNRSEDAGIVNTINTYYQPIVAQCSTQWTNTSRWLIQELLRYELNQTSIDAAGAAAFAKRTAYNQGLLEWASIYSVFSLGLCLAIAGIVWCKKWAVPWAHVFAENILFVSALAAYEYFFFRTIIYKYTTISTQELDKYIVDGLATCAVP
jgi:hypothetical protein